MGFFRGLQGIFDSEVMGENIIKAVIDLFDETSKYNPGDERHILLAKTYVARLIARRVDIDEGNIERVALYETQMFTSLPAGHDIRAFALHTLFKERPDIIDAYPKFGVEYARLMAPVLGDS